MNRDRQVPIQSLGKAMRLLDILQEQGRPMHLAELAELAGYPKSSVYALLTSMRAYSYIEQRADGRYALGIRLYECGRTVSAAWDISSVARPYLEQLAEQTGASAVITYLENGHIINLEQVAGRSGVQVLSEVGGVSSAELKEDVMKGIEYASWRKSREGVPRTTQETIESCHMEDDDKEFFEKMAQTNRMSGRAIVRSLSVARTIADMAQRASVCKDDLCEALGFRLREGVGGV